MENDNLIRYGVSIQKGLQDQFDSYIALKGYGNRSEAIRDLIRESLIKEGHANKEAVAIGSISIVYDHHIHELSAKLTDIQHDFQDCIISSMHVHIDHHNCMEVIIVKGKLLSLEALANKLAVIKGVKTGKLTLVY